MLGLCEAASVSRTAWCTDSLAWTNPSPPGKQGASLQHPPSRWGPTPSQLAL